MPNRKNNSKNNMGRPKKKIDYSDLEGLCMLQCTEEEIARFFKVSVDTIERRVKEHYGETFAELYKKFSEHGKISLRRAMYKKAVEEGNVVMQIWLSKNWLGFKDKIEHAGDEERPFTFVIKGVNLGDYPEPNDNKK